MEIFIANCWFDRKSYENIRDLCPSKIIVFKLKQQKEMNGGLERESQHTSRWHSFKTLLTPWALKLSQVENGVGRGCLNYANHDFLADFVGWCVTNICTSGIDIFRLHPSHKYPYVAGQFILHFVPAHLCAYVCTYVRVSSL